MLNLVKLALRRGPELLFSDATVTVHDGERVGLVGANGTGKSSLFAMILGELQPDAGDLALPPRVVIAHVAQETPADPRPALEYVLDGDHELREVERAIREAETAGDGHRLGTLHGRLDSIGGYSAPARAARLMHGLGFQPGDESRPVAEFSGGWRMRLNLAQALICRSDLLLLDEPTNHLDLDAVIWVQEWLLSYAGTLLLISHDREFLDGVCNRILHLEQKGMQDYSGNYTDFERQRSARLSQQQAAFTKQQQEIAHIRKYVDRFRAQANKARQAQSRLKALERMELIATAHVDSAFSFRFREPPKLPNPLLRLNDVVAGYDGTPLLTGVRLHLSPGVRIGLLGPNGAGKSTLVRVLAGELPTMAGERIEAQDLRIGYFAQHQVEQLDDKASALLHMQRIDPRATEQSLRDYLGGFGFAGDMCLNAVEPFSGGEKARLVLALVVYQRPNLLLLDEPTNHLDLDMRQALANALQDFQGALVVIAHDRHLLRSTADQLYIVSDGSAREFDGDLDDYARWLADRRGDIQNGTRNGNSADAGTPQDRRQRRREDAFRRQALAPLRKEVQKLELALQKLLSERQSLDARLADPALYDGTVDADIQPLLREQGELGNRISATEDAWMDALAKLEAAESDSEREID
ncbi:MAG: ATP-binding cassette domain-containing protein [Aquisalimonadaceae bacterium]